ncbi:WD40-repeat-containing domain protein [Lactarius pseudohatsudake]|nr:WD40-repeat-containing domain protein [Lactarius pseudohatsudake]
MSQPQPIVIHGSDSEPEHDTIARLSTTSEVVHGTIVEPDSVPPPSSLAMRKDFIWATAADLLHQNSRHMPHQPMNIIHQLPMVLGLAPISTSFAKAGGAINKIIQSPGCIAVSSAASGGQPDNQGAAEQPIVDPYNHEGTLQIWQENKGQSSTILHGHCLFEDQSPTYHKCYTVNSISFDPNQSQIMASAGNDCSVQLWLDDKKLVNGYYKYPKAPYDVVYQEKDSLLAVTCANGSVYVHSTQSGLPFGDPIDLHVTPLDVQQSVGSVVWGHGASADLLFASSEAQRENDYCGFHVAFDPDQRRCAYDFSVRESGDAMALDPDGEQLAICTVGPDSGTHSLRVYDVRRRNGQEPIQHIRLGTFDSGSPEPGSHANEDQVTTASFSPDGILLAVARSDDELHIYDSRFMGRRAEPMARYLHWDDDCCIGDKWGIVDAVWVDGWCGRGFGIITGGADGCVRFWDPRRSAEDVQNGEVLARPNVDVGHFSVGDPRNGEKPLVVGDNGGRVYVYDYAVGAGSSVF